MTLQSFLVLLGLIAFFVAAVMWISRNGGWQGEGCCGNCKECRSQCQDQDPKAHKE